jgi:site-specific DNA-methyltransferase (adenine-specific)
MRGIPFESFFQRGNVCIYNADILELSVLEKDSVDLIVTSPPYDVGVKYLNYDNIPYDRYLEFTRKWLSKVHGLAKSDGRLCLNIPLDKNRGGQQSGYADVAAIAKAVGWKYHSIDETGHI